MAAKPLRGYKLLPGTARRYRTPSGGTISRREYDDRRARASGWRNRYELEKFRERIAGSGWLGDIYTNTGKRPTWQDYADIKEVQDRRAAIEREHGKGTHFQMDGYDPELVAADGALARLLDRAGKRQFTGRPVGSS